jgi:hypothetical protein
MNEPNLRRILAGMMVEVIELTNDGWLKCACPFAPYLHSTGTDRNPSFFAKVDPGGLSGYHCFTCKQKGRISSLVRALEHYGKISYGNLAMEADLAEVPESFGSYETAPEMELDPEPLNKVAYMNMFPLAWEHADSQAYLTLRGISKETTERLRLQYDDEEQRVLFPVFNYEDELFGFSGRSILKQDDIDAINVDRRARGRYIEYSRIKDYAGLPKEKCLLGEQFIKEQKHLPLLVVEGLFAFAHMIEIGVTEFCNPIAPMGSRLSKYQRDLIVSHNRPVYLLFDNDAAGDIGIYGKRDEEGNAMGGGAFDMLKKHVPTFVPLYPEGKDDPDSLEKWEVQEMMIDL